MKRRTGLGWIVFAVLVAAVFGSAGSATPTESLIVLTWADYLDPELRVEFERESGVAIQFSYYSSDDHRDEILAASGGRNYDLVLVSGLMLETYAMRKWLSPISPENIPNLKHIEARWRNAFPGAERYAVPYFWGTLGIGYRKDLLPEGLSTWKEFFRPPESLRGRIAMPKNSRDVVGMALKSLGHSVNTDDRDAIREAGRLLEAQKPFVRTYAYVGQDERSALVTGEVWASMLYNGDALVVQEHHDEIEYVVPEEGSNLWVDYFAVLQSSTRKKQAERFIDFLNRPENAARNSRFTSYATPNVAARALLPREFLENPFIYPDSDVLSRSEIYRELPPRAQKTLNSVFARLVN